MDGDAYDPWPLKKVNGGLTNFGGVDQDLPPIEGFSEDSEMNDRSEKPLIERSTTPSETTAKIIYILYLVGFFTGGITTLVGLVMAYVYRGDASEWLKTHFQLQIRTFWIGFFYVFLGVLLLPIGVGLLILIFYLIWFVVRCIKGIKALDEQRAYRNPIGWGF